jgi:hypothetical protein
MLLAGRETPWAEKTDPTLQLSKPFPKRPQRINRRNEHYSVQSSVQVLHAHNQQRNPSSHRIPSHPSRPIPHRPHQKTTRHPHRSKKLIIKPPPCRTSHEIAPRPNLASHNPPLRSAAGITCRSQRRSGSAAPLARAMNPRRRGESSRRVACYCGCDA